jgi:hypothetical protein
LPLSYWVYRLQAPDEVGLGLVRRGTPLAVASGASYLCPGNWGNDRARSFLLTMNSPFRRLYGWLYRFC